MYCDSVKKHKPVFHSQQTQVATDQYACDWQSHVYAVGGNDGVASLSSVERFDPHLNKWTEVKEMGQRRAGNGVSKLNGCLYVVGERRTHALPTSSVPIG